MPLDEIQRGQTGQCLTVFEDDHIEPVTFSVKGVMPNFLGPNGHIVLVRLTGEKPEFTGVVAGMSGSPCSIDGKIIGALAYAYAIFAKEPIAGITPMQDMLDVMRLPAEKTPWRLPTKETAKAEWDALRRGEALAQAPSNDELRPIATPLSLGGVVPQVREHFTPWLRSLGFVPVATGAGGGPTASKKLEPGSPIAAVLVSGDVDIAATGTVTSVEGNEVLAFGHPFFGSGVTSMPMAHASILNTMASQMRSYKMSLTGALIGEITQDRLTAIGGYLGPSPKMVPVRGTFKTPSGTKSFSFEVTRDLYLSPRFVALGLANALVGNVQSSERGTVRLTGTVRAKGIEPVIVRDVFASQRDSSLLIEAAIEMARTFATFWNTPFGPPPEIELSVEAVLEPEPVIEWIESVHLSRSQARPGDSVEVAVRLVRDDGPRTIERFLLKVPRRWAKQKVDIIVAGGSLAQRLVDEVAGDPRPENLAQIQTWFANRRTDGYLYLLAVRKGTGMRSEVEAMPFLPPSVVAINSGDATKQRRNRGLAWEERRGRPGVVYGGLRTQLRVEAF